MVSISRKFHHISNPLPIANTQPRYKQVIYLRNLKINDSQAKIYHDCFAKSVHKNDNFAKMVH